MVTPADRFTPAAPTASPPTSDAAHHDRTGAGWVSRRVCANGIGTVSWPQVSVGRHRAGQRCDVHIDGDLLRFWTGDDLVKTAARTSTRGGTKQTGRTPAHGPNP